ncbi:hypothetical protein FOVG_09843 [Fusarium oxysporum f. sp. pisi HDV247]|uniref:Uncharacterized protein n=1 Tax=Fusarium oxysporum f. sp. pisi HDV247 TaxID=1080344 RepID=W9PNP7_FUSOX|nr:hypothetical protein FOVG_09843 [Fusarium oxysporum f. sp. pisi HDV247]
MADRMRTKETSLGHFKITKNLRRIGTRLHWSMVGLADVQELRETVISQMAAINVLLIVQQQTSIRRLTLQSQAIGTAQSMAIEKHATAMAGHASDILNIASKTQTAIGALEVSQVCRRRLIQSTQTR